MATTTDTRYDRWIDPEIAAVLETLSTLFGDLSDEVLPEVRRTRDEALALLQLSDAVERTDHVAPGRNGQPDVEVRVHRPVGLAGPAPCIYSIHGGGYVMGSHRMDDLRFDRWCTALDCVGVSVGYRLAPETAYPGPLEDCYAGLAWLHDHAAELGVDLERTGVLGVSAGGGLAAALTLLARERGGPSLAYQLLVYPMLDDRAATRSSRWQVPVWTPVSNAYGWRSYLGDLADATDLPATAAPARAEDLSGLPTAYLCVGTADLFCDEDVDYAQRLSHAGVPTELHVYPGATHGFEGMAPGTRLARRAQREMLDWLAERFAPPESA